MHIGLIIGLLAIGAYMYWITTPIWREAQKRPSMTRGDRIRLWLFLYTPFIGVAAFWIWDAWR